jgi:hypothetical protein
MSKINLKYTILALFILLVACTRIMVHIPNFTPLLSVALFGGAYFADKSKAILLTLGSLFISDMFIQGVIYQGQYGFPLYDGWYWNYGAYLLCILLATVVLKKISINTVVIASIAAPLIHWVLSNLGAWLGAAIDPTTGVHYTKDVAGFIKCFTLALPFLKDSLLSTALYSTVFFGGYELAKQRVHVLA